VAKKSVVVHIAGQRYVVRSDAKKSYIETLAKYVDNRVREVKSASKPVPSQSLAVLAALNIADELFQEKKKRRQLKQRIKEKSVAILGYLDQEVKARLQQ
jgi:cell division protein ZapA